MDGTVMVSSWNGDGALVVESRVLEFNLEFDRLWQGFTVLNRGMSCLW